MNTILTNKWHLHTPIGQLAMMVLVFLLGFSDSLSIIAIHGFSLFILFCGCFVFEVNQDRQLPLGQKQTKAVFWGDIWAGFSGGLVFAIAYLLGIETLSVVVLTIAGIVLEIYKRMK